MKKLSILLLQLAIATVAYGQEDTIRTEAITDSNVTTDSRTKTTLESPPPSAVLPTMNFSNSDLCTVGVAGAVQTQILGISAGKTVRDMNCERLKNAKVLYDMGMKVAAVSVMCQDKRVFDAMMNAGTPCPYDGLIGPEAKDAWASSDQAPSEEKEELLDDSDKTLLAGGGIASLLMLLLL
jgi:hypothetical protein